MLLTLNQRVASALTEDRVRAYALALTGALLTAFVLLLATADGVHTAGGGRVGGDWGSFYAAGQLAWQGQLSQLYDWDLQHQTQAPYMPGVAGVVPFPYPPLVALLYAPLFPLGFVPSYALHAVLMLLLTVLAVRLAAPLWPRLAPHWLVFAAAAASHPALYRGTFGGQNTAVMLLLTVLVARGVCEDRPAWSGAALGLMAFKPTYAVVVALILLAHGERRALAYAAGVWAVVWAATAALLGPAWPLTYVHALAEFAAMDWTSDLGRSVALAAMPRTAGVGAELGRPMGVSLGLGVLVALLPSLARARHDAGRWLGLFTGALLIASPHVGFYDAGLGVWMMAAIVGALGASAGPSVLLATAGVAWASWHEPPSPPLILFVDVVGLIMLLVYSPRAPAKPLTLTS